MDKKEPIMNAESYDNNSIVGNLDEPISDTIVSNSL